MFAFYFMTTLNDGKMQKSFIKNICFHLNLFKQDIHSFCKLEIRQLFCSHLGDKLIFYLYPSALLRTNLLSTV